MDKKFHPTLYNKCNYLSLLGFKLIHASKIPIGVPGPTAKQMMMTRFNVQIFKANRGWIVQRQGSRKITNAQKCAWVFFSLFIINIQLKLLLIMFSGWVCIALFPVDRYTLRIFTQIISSRNDNFVYGVTNVTTSKVYALSHYALVDNGGITIWAKFCLDTITTYIFVKMEID